MHRTYVFCTNAMYFATKGGIKVKSEEIVQKVNSAHLSYMYIYAQTRKILSMFNISRHSLSNFIQLDLLQNRALMHT